MRQPDSDMSHERHGGRHQVRVGRTFHHTGDFQVTEATHHYYPGLIDQFRARITPPSRVRDWGPSDE
jgi:hypothetical protein